MILNFELSTAQKSGFMSLPKLKHDGSWYSDANRNLDEAKVREELRSCEYIQFASNDGKAVLTLVVELLSRLKTALGNNDGVNVIDKDEPATPAEERMARGRFVTVRLSVTFGIEGFRLAVKIVSSKGTQVENRNSTEFARLFAQVIIDNLRAIEQDALEENGGRPGVGFRYIEGDGCGGIVAESVARDRRFALKKEYEYCERRHDCRTGDGVKLCSPCKFDCPLFRNGGRCAYEEECK